MSSYVHPQDRWGMSQSMLPAAPHNKILPFPAFTCSFYIQGRCSLTRTCHLQVADTARCRVLTLWERLQDEALEIAEEQDLDESAAMGVMADHMRRAQDLDLICPWYQSNGEDTALDCIFFHGHLCIQALPYCPGACSKYRTRSWHHHQQPIEESRDVSQCPSLLHLY